MGVELALVFCWHGGERTRVFSFLDTHKMLGACYDDFFTLEGIIPEKLDQAFLCKEYMGDLSTSGYGDIFQLFEPRDVLKIIQKNMDKLAVKEKVIDSDLEISDLEDERVQMAIGMLEKLSLMNGKSGVKVGFHWY